MMAEFILLNAILYVQFHFSLMFEISQVTDNRANVYVLSSVGTSVQATMLSMCFHVYSATGVLAATRLCSELST